MKTAERGEASPSPLDGLLHGQISRRDLLKLPLLAVAADQLDPQTAQAVGPTAETQRYNVLKVVTTGSLLSDAASNLHAVDAFGHVVAALGGIGVNHVGIQPLWSAESTNRDNFKIASDKIHAMGLRTFVEGVISIHGDSGASVGLTNREEYLAQLRTTFDDKNFIAGFAEYDFVVPVTNPEGGMLQYFPGQNPEELGKFLFEARGIVFDAFANAGTNIAIIQPMNADELYKVLDSASVIENFSGVPMLDDAPKDPEGYSQVTQDTYDALRLPIALSGMRVPLEGADRWESLTIEDQITAETNQANQIAAIKDKLLSPGLSISDLGQDKAPVVLYSYRGAVHSSDKLYGVGDDGGVHPFLGAQALAEFFQGVGETKEVAVAS